MKLFEDEASEGAEQPASASVSVSVPIPPVPAISGEEDEEEEQEEERLNLTKRDHDLYGREEQQQLLYSLVQDTIRRQDIPSSGPQICLVHGHSGSGKTTLCESIYKMKKKEATTDKSSSSAAAGGAFLASGKFDQYQDFSDPYSALVTAFDSLGKEILATKDKNILGRYQDALGGSNNILTKLIPSFTTLESLRHHHHHHHHKQQQNNDNNSNNIKHHHNDNESEVHNNFHRSLSPCIDAASPSPSAGTTTMIPSSSTSSSPSSPSATTTYPRGTSYLQPHHQQQQSHHLELASERLAVSIRSFLENVCTPNEPIVLFIDDLQWIDSNSRDVISAILTTIETNHFLFLGCYRDEEEYKIQPFLEALQQQQQTTTNNSNNNSNEGRNNRMTDIQLHNLTVSQVDEFVADMLGYNSSSSIGSNSGKEAAVAGGAGSHGTITTPTTTTQTTTTTTTIKLSEFIHQKTEGNPYFVIQFLHILEQHDLVSYDTINNLWLWDMEQIRRPSGAIMDASSQESGVAYFVTERILQLSSVDLVHAILKVAACLGFAVDVKLLEYLVYHQESSFLTTTSAPPPPTSVTEHHSKYCRALEKAEAEELIQVADGTCKFTHDRVQQCVYELIPMGAVRDALHFRTGKLILQYSSSSSSSSSSYITEMSGRGGNNNNNDENGTHWLFLAADQCNRGSSSIENSEDERLELIRLNLRASKAANNKSGVSLVADFLDKAIELIRDQDWEKSYDLVLQIYSASAEVESARGKFDRSDRRVEQIRERTQNAQDKVRALAVRARSLGAQQEYMAALVEARRALALLGVRMPPKSRYVRVMVELIKMRKMLKNKTEDDFLNLEPMTDQRMVMAMRILQFGVTWGWNVDIYFGSLCYLVMLRLTMEHGRCYLAPFAFAGFGNMLANFLKKEEEACWFGQLAGRFEPDKDSIPATTMVRHAYLSHLRLPVSTSLEPLLLAYRVSLETGDLSMGTICLCLYHWVYKFCGLPLGPLSTDLRKYLAELRLCQQEFLLAFLLPDLHLALNLTGQTDDPNIISWENICRSDLFVYKTVIPSEHPAELNRLYTQIFNALILGDSVQTEKSLLEVLSRSGVYRRFDGSHVCNQFFIFLDGLASFVLLRKRRRRKDARVADEARRQLRRMSKSGLINCVGMLQFLIAEQLSLRVPPRWENRRKASWRLEAWLGAVKRAYDVAIAQLSRSGFFHYSALANERIGEFMLMHGDQYWAEHYLSKAMTLFHDWGASVKVELLLDTYAFLQPDAAEESAAASSSEISITPHVSVRARARYNSTVDSVVDLISDREFRADRSERNFQVAIA